MRGSCADISPHIGNLDSAESCRVFEQSVRQACEHLDWKPDIIAYDMHPDFFSTQLALRLSDEWRIPAVAVQHHHAHTAAIMAEHRHIDPVLGLILDGMGYGDDGAVWGGELLVVDGAAYQRYGHLRPLSLPGGDAAAKEPWRMAVSALVAAGSAGMAGNLYSAVPSAEQLIQLMASRNGRFPKTTSMGRLFDAAASLLGICHLNTYEGQAAMLLESQAHGVKVRSDGAQYEIYPENGKVLLDLLPLLLSLCSYRRLDEAAAFFHAALAKALADWVAQASASTGISTVVCGGGCMLNSLLSKALGERLEKFGITVLEANAMPPGDGGLSLGQAWVARMADLTE